MVYWSSEYLYYFIPAFVILIICEICPLLLVICSVMQSYNCSQGFNQDGDDNNSEFGNHIDIEN